MKAQLWYFIPHHNTGFTALIQGNEKKETFNDMNIGNPIIPTVKFTWKSTLAIVNDRRRVTGAAYGSDITFCLN